MEELYITLYDESGKELPYRVERIFEVDGSEQLYCSAVPVDNGDIVFLRCDLSENGENTEVTIADIPDDAEYERVISSYNAIALRTSIEGVKEELSAKEDYITLTDKDGNKVDFIVHTIFEDEESRRSHIALQKVDETGRIFEEISLYRFNEENADAVIDMIPSDMEYERVRNLFIRLLDNS